MPISIPVRDVTDQRELAVDHRSLHVRLGNPGAAGPSVQEAGPQRIAASTCARPVLHPSITAWRQQPLKLCAAAARPRQAMARPLYSQARLLVFASVAKPKSRFSLITN